MKYCKNCGNDLTGNFCSYCGQKSDVDRLDFKYVQSHFRKIFFKYFDKGIIYTCKQLVTRPGHTIREYLEGKRIKHYDPITLFITLGALYGIFSQMYSIEFLYSIKDEDLGPLTDKKSLNLWIDAHYSIFMSINIPIISIVMYYVYNIKNHNLIEILVYNFFVSSLKILIRLLFLPVNIYYNSKEEIAYLYNFFLIIDLLLFILIYVQFHCSEKVILSIRRAIAIQLIYILSFSLLLFLFYYIYALLYNLPFTLT
ncbi:MAG: DUF3667 domain-containing protein [Cytophagaceae bacterium]|jgi:hypothetical protein|nr:DUF3667 domain-containing protein [Cytophagaceae bacterium]